MYKRKDKTNMIEPDYSTFRKLMKHMRADISETEVYQMWKGVMEPGWSVQTKAAPGYDGHYHLLYLSECLDDGRIYVGKHSTLDLSDGYQGSGYEVRDAISLGKKFKTTPLEFFKTSDEAYLAEKLLVNSSFLRSPNVLNRVLGGKSEDSYDAQPVTQEVKTVQKVDVYRANGKKKGKGDPFSALGVKVGDELTYVKDSNVKCKAVNEWAVEWNGKNMGLSDMLSEVQGFKFSGNPLNMFMHNGKNLGEVQKALKRK